MNKKSILITVKKELRSIFRDKKTTLMILGFPLIIGVMIFLFGFMEESIAGEDDKKSIIGINYEIDSNHKAILSECNLKAIYYQDKGKIVDAYNSGKIEAYILYDDKKNKYTVYSNEDIMASTAGSNAITYLDGLNRFLGDQYIKGEDIDPEEVYNNFSYEIKTTEGKEISPSVMITNMVMDISFTYIIMAIGLATVNMATSAIAVEKENGTLETILTLPIKVKDLVIGKYIATVIIGVISSVLGLLITGISFNLAENIFEVYDKVTISIPTFLLGVIICIVASLLIGALAILITSSSKSYKEAQASGQVLQILCIIPMFLSYLNFKITSITYLIPILNHTNILMDLFSNNLSYMNLFVTIISSILYSLILVYILIKKFKQEKVLFGA